MDDVASTVCQTLDRGKARTEQEKAAAMQKNNAKAAAPRIAELAAAVMEACSCGEYKGAAQHYKEFKTMQAGTLPLPVFEAMLDLYSRLRMPSSAEGVFIDMLVAGHAPTEAVCWSLLTTFEAAGEATRADKVLAYMEAQGMS